MNEHKPKCKCAICQGGVSKEEALANLREWENDCIAKYGFYVHYVNLGEAIDVHTHGLVETHNHADLQIVFPIDLKTSHSVINSVVERIEEGEVFVDGQVAEGIIENFSVKFIEVEENGRKVLRIILPDEKGRIERDKISKKYAIQYGDNPEWIAYKPK